MEQSSSCEANLKIDKRERMCEITKIHHSNIDPYSSHASVKQMFVCGA